VHLCSQKQRALLMYSWETENLIIVLAVTESITVLAKTESITGFADTEIIIVVLTKTQIIIVFAETESITVLAETESIIATLHILRQDGQRRKTTYRRLTASFTITSPQRLSLLSPMCTEQTFKLHGFNYLLYRDYNQWWQLCCANIWFSS